MGEFYGYCFLTKDGQCAYEFDCVKDPYYAIDYVGPIWFVWDEARAKIQNRGSAPWAVAEISEIPIFIQGIAALMEGG